MFFFLLPGFGEKNLTIFLSVIKLLTAIVKKKKNKVNKNKNSK